MNKKLLLIIGILILVSLFLVLRQTGVKVETPKQPQVQATPSENDKPKIVATKPDPLEGAIVSGSQPLELTFNRSLENEGELKLRIEPPIDMKITLSQDRKTATLTPQKPYELSQTYTIFIKGDTKFTGVGAWGEEKIFHFQTIKYRGV